MKMSDALAFKQFYDANSNIKISVMAAYKLAKINKIVTEEVEFYSSQMQNIFSNMLS